MIRIMNESYSYDLFNELCSHYELYDNISLEEIYDEIYNKYNDENLASDVVSEIEEYRYNLDAGFNPDDMDDMYSGDDAIFNPYYESSEDDYDPKDSGKVSNSIQYNGCEIRYDDTGDWYISIPQGGDKMPKFVAGFSTEEDAQEYIDTHVKKSERWVKIEPDEPEDQEELGESYDIEPDPEQRKIFRRVLNKVLDDNNCNNSIGAYDRFIRQMRDAWEGTGHDEEYLYNVMSRALKSYKPTR